MSKCFPSQVCEWAAPEYTSYSDISRVRYFIYIDVVHFAHNYNMLNKRVMEEFEESILVKSAYCVYSQSFDCYLRSNINDWKPCPLMAIL